MIGTNTSHLIAGRMLICDGMEWRAVCHGEWDREDATVVCRQLGFPATGKPSIYFPIQWQEYLKKIILLLRCSHYPSQAKNKSAES